MWIVERIRYLQTDQSTNRPTDTASYGGALSHLKRTERLSFKDTNCRETRTESHNCKERNNQETWKEGHSFKELNCQERGIKPPSTPYILTNTDQFSCSIRISRFCTFQLDHHGATEGRRTDKVSHRVACPQLKTK